MELTIVLSVPSRVEDYDLLDTLDSVPWGETGVDLIVYSGDTKKVKKIITSGDLDPIIRDSKVDVLFCETPEDDSQHHTIGLEDTKTDGVMFLTAGDIIEDFQTDLLTTTMKEPVGIPGIGQEGTPETITCFECRTLPDSYRGIVFNVDWLRGKGITNIGPGMMEKVCNVIVQKIQLPEYWKGWSDFDISESLSVTRTLTDEKEVIKSLEGIWNSGQVLYSPYLKDMVWSRIMTSAARITTNSDTSNYFKYLYPTQKVTVLH